MAHAEWMRRKAAEPPTPRCVMLVSGGRGYRNRTRVEVAMNRATLRLRPELIVLSYLDPPGAEHLAADWARVTRHRVVVDPGVKIEPDRRCMLPQQYRVSHRFDVARGLIAFPGADDVLVAQAEAAGVRVWTPRA